LLHAPVMCWEAMGLVDRLFIDSPLAAETAASCGSGSPVFTPAATTRSRGAIRPREKQPQVITNENQHDITPLDSFFCVMRLISVFSEIHRKS